jgi:hypothetical protein
MYVREDLFLVRLLQWRAGLSPLLKGGLSFAHFARWIVIT